MDYTMPGMNGPEAAEKIRLMGFGGLIVGVTGNALAEDVDHFLKKGADAVLTKPLDTSKLSEILATAGYIEATQTLASTEMDALSSVSAAAASVTAAATVRPHTNRPVNTSFTISRRSIMTTRAENDVKFLASKRDAAEGDEVQILVVDSCVSTRTEIVEMLMDKRVCECPLQASDTSSAVSIIQEAIEGTLTERAPKVIIINHSLPLVDGPELVELVRAVGFQGKLVGLVDAHAPSEVTDSLNTNGCELVITKPLKVNKLLEFLGVPSSRDPSSSRLLNDMIS
jgi:CheY-like chemotaxis protein